jgi:hypothetical protein
MAPSLPVGSLENINLRSSTALIVSQSNQLAQASRERMSPSHPFDSFVQVGEREIAA